MADVRINALSTTATSSASDDYLAIDGSANGTRKLSAYSPTFGGNLTVSGTGTSSVAGKALIGTTTDNSTGALEVNGTIVAEQYANFAWRTSKFLNRLLSDSSAYASTISGDAFAVLTNNAERMIVGYNGNVLVGTTTDGGQKLQVAGTLSVSDSITGPTLTPGLNTAGHYLLLAGASTSWPLRASTIYDANYVDQYLTLNGVLTGTRATPTFTGAATGGGYVRVDGSTGSIILGTFVGGAGAAAVPALTLKAGDATFAGTIALGQYTTAGAPAYAKGKLYFDVTLNKLRVGGATGWETVTSV